MSLLNNTCLLVQVRFQIPEREYKPEVSTVMHKGMEKHQKKRRKMPRSGEEDDIKPSCAPKKGGTVNDMDELRRGASMHKLFLETHIPKNKRRGILRGVIDCRRRWRSLPRGGRETPSNPSSDGKSHHPELVQASPRALASDWLCACRCLHTNRAHSQRFSVLVGPGEKSK